MLQQQQQDGQGESASASWGAGQEETKEGGSRGDGARTETPDRVAGEAEMRGDGGQHVLQIENN
jgi:hypothetical protein